MSLTVSQRLEFEAFVHEHAPDLMRQIIYGTAANWHEAEDALWTVLGDVWRRWPKIEHPLTYIRLSAIRRIGAQRRREVVRKNIESEAASNSKRRSADSTEGSVWEDHEWVMALLGELPRRQAEVLACVYDGMSTREIGQLLGTNEPAVRKRLSEARRSVRSIFELERRGNELERRGNKLTEKPLSRGGEG